MDFIKRGKCKNTGKVDYIEETFAWNSWCKNQKGELNARIAIISGVLIGVLMIAVLIGRPIYIMVQQQIIASENMHVQLDVDSLEVDTEQEVEKIVTTDSAIDDTVYTSDEYGLSLTKLGTDVVIESNGAIIINDSAGNFVMSIVNVSSEGYQLREYVSYVAGLNGDAVDLGVMQAFPVDHNASYTISTIRSFTDDTGTYEFSDEHPVHVFIFFEHGLNTYRVEFPESLGSRSLEVVNSIRFE